MSEQQVLNYLQWLRDRGQAFAFPSQISEDGAKEHRIKLKIIFASEIKLQETESEMIFRIAAALGLKSEDFRIILADSLHEFDPNFIIGLGNFLDPSPHTINIPHPSEMLAEPKLKVSAWDRLLKVKAQL